MATLETITVNLLVSGQPEVCKKLYADGWRFSYCKDTRFVSAEHPNGGKMSVVEFPFSSWSDFDANEIGSAIAMLLNGGNHSR